MNTTQLYNFAEKNNVQIYSFRLDGHKALSVPLEDGVCAVAMDVRRMSQTDEKEALAHELGHCMTGTFYTSASPMVTRARCETKARKWAVRHLVSERQLRRLVSGGNEVWEIAEILDVDEKTVVDAVNLYYYNHL